MIVRISVARFDPAVADRVGALLADSERTLRAPIEALPGNHSYLVGIDRERGAMTNTSTWDTLEHARAMASMPEMAALRESFEAAGVTFTDITDHEVLWQV